MNAIQVYLRKCLGAVGFNELQMTRSDAKQALHQLTSRLNALEDQMQGLRRPQLISQDGPPFSIGLQESVSPSFTSENPWPPSSRSITRFGLRFTLNDSLWAHAGKTSSDLLTDQQLSAMIQGPFCPNCLKRWFKREGGGQVSDLSNRCRFCGVTWVIPPLNQERVHVIDLKRWIYDHVDQDIRLQSTKRPLSS